MRGLYLHLLSRSWQCFLHVKVKNIFQLLLGLSIIYNLVTQVQSLSQEDPLEEEMATHSSIIVWEIIWTEESGGLQFNGSWRVGHDWVTQQQEASGVFPSYLALFSLPWTWFLTQLVYQNEETCGEEASPPTQDNSCAMWARFRSYLLLQLIIKQTNTKPVLEMSVVMWHVLAKEVRKQIFNGFHPRTRRN